MGLVVWRRLWLAASVVLMTACASTPSPWVDYDPQADFSSLRTYYLLDPLATGPVSPLELKRARQAVQELLDVNYRQAEDPQTADFQVRVHFVAVEKVAVYDDGFGVYGGYRNFGLGWRSPARVRQYRQNTLVLDILDADSSPIWQSSVPSRVMRSGDPLQQYQQLRAEAAHMLEQFPPLNAEYRRTRTTYE